MRKSLWMLPVVLLFTALGSPAVRAESYTATFTCTGTCVFSPGVTDNPVTFPSPVLDITVDGDVFAVTLPSEDSPTDSYTWTEGIVSSSPCCLSGDYLTAGSIVITDSDTIGPPDFVVPSVSIWVGISGTQYAASTDSGSGTLTFTPVETPEPGTSGLMLSGLGVIGVLMWKRRRRMLFAGPQAACGGTLCVSN